MGRRLEDDFQCRQMLHHIKVEYEFGGSFVKMSDHERDLGAMIHKNGKAN